MHGAAQLSEDRFVNARLCHLGIGHNITAAAKCLNAFCHGIFREHKIVSIIKIGSGMDRPFDHQFVLRVQHFIAQQLRNDLKASLFNVHRFDILNHNDASPLGKCYRN